MDKEKIKNILDSELSGFFTRGELSEHDAKIVQKWVDKFIKFHEEQGDENAGS